VSLGPRFVVRFEFLVVHQLSRKSGGGKKARAEVLLFGTEYLESNAFFWMNLSSSSFWLCFSNLNMLMKKVACSKMAKVEKGLYFFCLIISDQQSSFFLISPKNPS